MSLESDSSRAMTDAMLEDGVQNVNDLINGLESAESIDANAVYVDLADNISVSTEALDGRKRRIAAQVKIPHSPEAIWQILTHYDSLADFIPNLSESKRIEHPHGGIRILQVGSENLLKLKFCAKVVLDMVESFPHRLDFNMVEGDFREFSGYWELQPVAVNNQTGTSLEYVLDVVPHRLMPIGLIERKLCENLKVNLASIYHRAESLF